MQQRYQEKYPYQEDEIDLRKLVKSLIERWRFIFGFTALITLLTVAYVLSLTPPPIKFIAKTTFTEPSESSVIKLNKSGHLEETRGTIHSAFLNNINKKPLQKKVFIEGGFLTKLNKENLPINGVDSYISGFLSSISISLGKDITSGIEILPEFRHKYSEPHSLTIQGFNPEILTEYLNELVVKANIKTVSDFINIIEEKNAIRLANISSKRKFLLKEANKSRLNEIEILTFAAQIAESLGIKESNFNQPINYEKTSNLLISVGQELPPNWYLYGETALRESARLLEEREDDTAFIPELVGLEIEESQIKSLIIDASGINAVQLLQSAKSEKILIKSQNKQIVLMALFGSFGLSMVLALLMNSLKEDETELTTKNK